MHDRRKMPKGTPQEEMEAARKELEVVWHYNIFFNLTDYFVNLNVQVIFF